MNGVMHPWESPHFMIGGDHQSPRFNAFTIAERLASGNTYPAFVRRDFYKIMLFHGEAVFHFGDESIAVSGDTLLFFHPRLPYTHGDIKTDISGYCCVFTEEFFREYFRGKLDDIPLFQSGAKPIFSLEAEAVKEVTIAFDKIISELRSEYVYRFELIRSYIMELIYYALKLAPFENTQPETNASARITAVFSELLERQFPVDVFSPKILLRTPKDFAERLAIHVNYLNRAVKKETGKTTSELILSG
ncbi:AraC family transcriptional regulator [Chitinophaga pinensis]|uniref:AraC family transcriptional regulator n=1 Tax=Chitinophaga pinensis TaxID=79329 RepID=A0A5C6LSK7_9BACT|nr:AraC family transcriptional regulator [Chitinophaga pinensis]TWV99663.1 AraC family transcriptional regulator [Chitinophaga pinensis]